MLRTIMHVPAFITLRLWIVPQLVSGWGMLSGNGGGGVAYEHTWVSSLQGLFR